MTDDPKHNNRAAQGRMAAGVIVFTGVLWIVATWAGNHFDWPVRSRLLFDLMALGGFGFALAVIWRLWRSRRNDEG